MKNTIKKLAISVAVVAMLLTSANAGSVGGFGGSLEITQDAQWAADIGDRAISYSKQLQQYATQVMQYQQQIQQYVNQFQSYKMMLQNIGQSYRKLNGDNFKTLSSSSSTPWSLVKV